jgi:hypothetical protein
VQRPLARVCARVWRTIELHDIRTLAVLFGLCVAVFLATIPLPRADQMLIGSDGVRYYLYVRSLVIDGDLDFRNEWTHFVGADNVPADTPAGRPPNIMPIGMGLVWAPFFFAAHALSGLLGLPTDGYGYVYQAAVCLGSMIYGFIGLLLAYALAREYADTTSALVAVVLLWFAGNVAYYMVIEPSMSHMASMGTVSALLAWWRLRRTRRTMGYWIGLGALGGLAALIRPQDALFLLLPATQWSIEAGDRFRRGRGGEWAAHLAHGAAMACTAALVFCIQLWAWWVVFGSLRGSGYFSEGADRFRWLQPHPVAVLFSAQHGLFLWHPIYLAGAIGLWRLVKLDRAYAAALITGVALQVYLVASWKFWSQGDAFGGRMFISSFPIFAIGLALLVQRVRRRSWALVTVPGAVLLLWNFALLLQYRLGFIPKGQPSLDEVLGGKFTLLASLWDRLFR